MLSTAGTAAPPTLARIPLGGARDHPAACASGGRSALSAKTPKDAGYRQVYNLGAFKHWAESGGDVDHPIEPGMS